MSLRPLVRVFLRQIDAIEKSKRQDILVHVHRGLKRFIGALEIVQKQPIAMPLSQAMEEALPAWRGRRGGCNVGGRRRGRPEEGQRGGGEGERVGGGGGGGGEGMDGGMVEEERVGEGEGGVEGAGGEGEQTTYVVQGVAVCTLNRCTRTTNETY